MKGDRFLHHYLDYIALRIRDRGTRISSSNQRDTGIQLAIQRTRFTFVELARDETVSKEFGKNDRV